MVISINIFLMSNQPREPISIERERELKRGRGRERERERERERKRERERERERERGGGSRYNKRYRQNLELPTCPSCMPIIFEKRNTVVDIIH